MAQHTRHFPGISILLSVVWCLAIVDMERKITMNYNRTHPRTHRLVRLCLLTLPFLWTLDAVGLFLSILLIRLTDGAWSWFGVLLFGVLGTLYINQTVDRAKSAWAGR